MKKVFISLVLTISLFSQLMQGSDVFAQEEQSTCSKKIMYCVLGGGAAICAIYGVYHHLPLIKSLWCKQKDNHSDKKTEKSNVGDCSKTHESILSQIKEQFIHLKGKVSELAHDPRVVGLKDQISELTQNPELREMVISEYKRTEEQVNWAFDRLCAFMFHVGTKIQEECKDRYEHYLNTKKGE